MLYYTIFYGLFFSLKYPLIFFVSHFLFHFIFTNDKHFTSVLPNSSNVRFLTFKSNISLTFQTPSNTQMCQDTPSLGMLSYHPKYKGPSALFPKCEAKGRWLVCFSHTVNAKGTLYFLLWSQVHFSF